MKKIYKGFNKNLTKENLNKMELKCYNKLMEGINKSSNEEKNEVAHLMEIFVEAEEGTFANCNRCGIKFKNTFEGTTEINKRIYCDKCIKKMWSPIN